MSGSVAMTILTGGTGQAAGSLVGPATDAGKGIYKSLKHKYDYIKHLDQNFEKLQIEARYLSSREKDVNDLIAKNQVVMEKTHECATWLEDVEKTTTKLNDLETGYQFSKSSCAVCQLRTRLKLSREMVKMTKFVADLKDRMNLEHIITERHPERVEKKFPKKLNEVPSLRENVEKLLELLNDDDIKKIGLWGMSGVGKTTIMENLNDEVAKLQIFDIVLWVTVSKEDTLHQIQQSILNRLNLKVELIDAATLISKALENKKYLLLLDEVSSKIDLRHIGIHDSHMKGKVVLATRERFICHFMETDEDIKVERLSRDDARKLFRDAVGEVFDHPNIEPIAERVLKQCGELPQVIRAVGRHLKDKLNEDLWQNTLTKLQSPTMFQLKHMDDILSVFKLLYEDLHECLKNCLLYGASFPEDHEIYRDYLIECWKSEQLIGVDQTLRKACEEGEANLDDLIEKDLLDRCKSTKYVKMPIVFRNAAVRIAQQLSFGLLIRDGEELDELPPLWKWRNARVISLMNSSLTELPERPECARVSTLFLQNNENLSIIPETFFEHMSSLKVLDLYGTGIKELPLSISKLTDLRGLYLNDCYQLVDLPDHVGKLQNLEILDICRTGIRGLPAVIRELTCLQCLRISFIGIMANQNHVETNGMEVAPSKIFEGLRRLEELTIDADPKDPRWNKMAPAIAAELAYLSKLSALSFYFPNAESLETFTQASSSWKNGTYRKGGNFRSFYIYVGRTSNSTRLDLSGCSGRRYLQYSGGKDIPNVIKEVLSRACAFKLVGHQNITNFSDFGIDGMKSLEICVVEGCNAMETVIESNRAETCALPWLRELHLLKLEQLKHISQGPISTGSFRKLMTLTLHDCPNVTEVVSWDIAKELIELQHLRVENCSHVAKIIGTGVQSSDNGVFPKLKILELLSLERLVSIHSDYLFVWHALQEIKVIECNNLVNLCLNTMNSLKLRSIRCTEACWGALMLSDEIRAHLLRICCFIEGN